MIRPKIAGLVVVLTLTIGTLSRTWAEEKDEHGHGDAHGHGEEEREGEPSSSVGAGKAILEAKRSKGLRLNEPAIRRLALKWKPLSDFGPGPWSVPETAIVRSRDEAAIYISRGEGWFQRVEVARPERNSGRVRVSGANLRPTDQIVTEGVALLQVAELEAWGASGDGHGH